mmetsp:Transcript_131570/g.380591  ORF Transcript_131570/g.380591 Transcript_131570/m.380591 type:complete len:206 (-) Transcript_131570:204-821(-)
MSSNPTFGSSKLHCNALLKTSLATPSATIIVRLPLDFTSSPFSLGSGVESAAKHAAGGRRSFKFVSPSKLAVDMKARPLLALRISKSAGKTSSWSVRTTSPHKTSCHGTCLNLPETKSNRQHFRKFSAMSSRRRRISSYKSFKAVHSNTPAKGNAVEDHAVGEKGIQTKIDTPKKKMLAARMNWLNNDFGNQVTTTGLGNRAVLI